MMEASTLLTNIVELAPRHLCCLRCCAGGGCPPAGEEFDFPAMLGRLMQNPETHIRLVCAFDHCGAKTPLYENTTPEQRKRDLDVLYRTGFVPGDVRTARDLFYALEQYIPHIADICSYGRCPEGNWTPCDQAIRGVYESSAGFIAWPQNPEQMAGAKTVSCAEIIKAEEIRIRPHHLLCLICFHGRDDNDRPLQEDNLYEVLTRIRQEPDLMLYLVDGPGVCMICPPCHAFLPERGLCTALCHLRDRKKDLETLCRLGLRPGDRIRAGEALERIRCYIKSPVGICGLSSPNQFEWADCGGVSDGRYEAGYRKLFG